MQIENIGDIQAEFDFADVVSLAKIGQESAQKHCWRMLNEVNQVIDLSCVDILEVWGPDGGAHIALLARLYPNLAFEFGNPTNCDKASRVLWVTGDVEISEIAEISTKSDAIVIAHLAQDAIPILQAISGYARIAAKRRIGADFALSVFGKGLLRDIYRTKVRSH
ncbi:MAG: hypothetical protein FD163_800 [Hyphomonadaceae bacterium]|nr:MAG: hypothetical protein FD128_2218 [Hyphomonadaceae bacterium]KAF0186132.1 MAG: hypothetical protein FD163_800 [Hyphomonadaceae bacterium]